MPKKIEDPLKEGLISKIYLAAFNEYTTMYDLAQNVLDVRPHQVSRWVNERYPKLFEKKVERKKKKPIRAKVEPFLKKLEANLKEDAVRLTKQEKEQLKEFLNGPFRKATQKKYLDIDWDKDVDAYSELLGLLLSITGVERAIRTSISLLKKSHRAHLQEKMRKQFYDVWQNRAPKELDMGPVPWGDNEIFEPVKEFPDKLFDKLEKADLGGSREVLKKHNKFYEKLIDKILSKIRN
ncbi:hypothetical protein AKJ65_00625 [candidate division MSBL1 archaeon SCGC-AAA259E19]|uniref:Uncharacterized protein n=1 Tax=candidate division MSBL1 archaeon SCGC-AAA259E19 TaxID=1698264 RepID=A0A133UNM3_9EURY|nr:hypothetical protein AKJ65_00625 [candidate division MSBL1 archaeon SCGC-AAA259E19]